MPDYLCICLVKVGGHGSREGLVPCRSRCLPIGSRKVGSSGQHCSNWVCWVKGGRGPSSPGALASRKINESC